PLNTEANSFLFISGSLILLILGQLASCNPGPIDKFCEGKEVGIYADPYDISSFYQCLGNVTIYSTCQNGLIFDIESKWCIRPLTSPPPQTTAETLTTLVTTSEGLKFCKGKIDGFYEDPEDITSYFVCLNGKTTHIKCLMNLVFSIKVVACIFPIAVTTSTTSTPRMKDTTTPMPTTPEPTTTTTTTPMPTTPEPTTTTTTPMPTTPEPTTTTTTPMPTTPEPTTTTTTTPMPTTPEPTTTTTTTPMPTTPEPTTTTTTPMPTTPEPTTTTTTPMPTTPEPTTTTTTPMPTTPEPTTTTITTPMPTTPEPTTTTTTPMPTTTKTTTTTTTTPMPTTPEPTTTTPTTTPMPTTSAKTEQATSTSAGVDPNFCQDKENGFYPDPWDRTKFFQCVWNQTFHLSCPEGLVFNPTIDVCVWPADVTTEVA
ncbi:integumentary mucin A.1-like, partial [Narcine bancroftii]|uniref:integumentary mucin A.1-like n=1 Tax=Narcine bancroftii TaxID=1343680 RepID=UPI0038312828